jgi:hypothetical protein
VAALALVDYVFGPMSRDFDPIDRAICIEEKIVEHAEMEAELEELRGKVAEDIDYEEKVDELRNILFKLVEAIDEAKIGKLAKVGGLVIVETDPRNLAVSLGDALKAAREAL